MYPSFNDPAQAYEDAVAEGNYELALAISLGISQAQNQAAVQEAYAMGERQGFSLAYEAAKEPPREQGAAEEAAFAEQQKSPAQKTRERIVKVHRDDQYDPRVLDGLT
jgi:hypothetical protein